MKKILVCLLTLLLLGVVSPMSVFATPTDDEIKLSISVGYDDTLDVYVVDIPASLSFVDAAEKPIIEIKTGFSNAKVYKQDTGTALSGVKCSNGVVSFEISEGGTYIIEKPSSTNQSTYKVVKTSTK